MRSAALVVPGSLSSRTGGYIYDRRISEGLQQQDRSIQVHELPNGYPFPDSGALRAADVAFASIPAGTITLVDGLAFGAMPSIAEHHAARLRLVPIVHLPLASDVGLDAHTAASLKDSEQRSLMAARLVIVTGAATIELLRPYGVPAGRIAVIEPGTDPAPISRGSGGAAVELLCVGTLNAGKDHQTLLQALARCPGHRHLTCAGSLTSHVSTANEIRALVDRLGLGGRVSLAGDLDAQGLEAAYDRADAFVLATRRETFGMAVAEALAHGLPVVSTMTGAIPDLVDADAGILVRPGDIAGLADALTRVIAVGALRAQLREGALRARDRLQTWDTAAATMSAVLDRLASHA
jgi:glycosyltransferase involved in cell wall biosynthesis